MHAHYNLPQLQEVFSFGVGIALLTDSKTSENINLANIIIKIDLRINK